MKKIYLILLLVSFQSFSQNNGWFGYQLDSFAKFKLPVKNASLFDSIDSGVEIYELSAKLNGVHYVGSKSVIEQSILPSDPKELYELYDNAVSQVKKSFPNSEETKSDITKSGYQGRKYTLKDENNFPVYSAELYLLENNLYMFYYINDAKEETVDSDYFFRSIFLSEDRNIEQFKGSSDFFKMMNLFKIELLVVLGIFGLIITLIIKNRKKTA
ncbi:MAG TPA: hypothetical protein VIM94_01660 [Salegentibacter sp.]|uniref:hypothetical protein n=1 Tax=Salegentibacter sp. TaxID=1903072 RepID=UPI002F925F72